MGVDVAELVRRGRTNPDDEGEPFGVTQFSLRSSRIANGVSARHGEVARGMWQGLWPDRAVEDVPIAHVTNGVHIPTWIGAPMRALLDRHLGEDWMQRAVEPSTWDAVDEIPDAELWEARSEQRRALIELVKARSVTERLQRGDTPEYVRAAVDALDPDVLTIGFARRVATYKRLDLLLRDVDRALSLLADGDRPVQFLLAGKAHPRDDDGKRLVQRLFEMKGHPQVGRRVVYLDDYDVALGAAMTRGCDIWVNVPRPAAGGVGHVGHQVRRQRRPAAVGARRLVAGGLRRLQRLGDRRRGRPRPRRPGLAPRARALRRCCSSARCRRSTSAASDGLPTEWLAMVRSALRTIGPNFGAGRMVLDYVRQIYPPEVPAGV